MHGIVEELPPFHPVFKWFKTYEKVQKLDKSVTHKLDDPQQLSRFEVYSSLLLRKQNNFQSNRNVCCKKNSLRQQETFGQCLDTDYT